MGTFDTHTDIHDLPELQGAAGLAPLGLFLRCGSWTSAHGQTGVVPRAIAEDFATGNEGSIDVLVQAGLWEPIPEGYRMLRGPHADPDQPMPLWRYGDGDIPGLFAIDDTPNT